MASKELNVKVKHRFDTALNWKTNNPILLAGEFGVESDTQKIKIGNGSSAWNSLKYFATDYVDKKLEDYVDLYTDDQFIYGTKTFMNPSDGTSVKFGGSNSSMPVIVVTSSTNSSYQQVFQKKAGTIALLSDITENAGVTLRRWTD